jgi:cytochrome c oxidase cbb3-type subunit III
MRCIAAGLLLASTAALAQQPKQDSNKTNPLGHSEQVVEEGRKLFNDHCTVCHGMSGTEGERGPALAAGTKHRRQSDQDIFDAVEDGIPGTGMAPVALATMDIWKVVAYIRDLRATAYDAAVQGDAAKGEQIFWGKGQCGQCHMIHGRGAILGPDLSNIGGEQTLQHIHDSLTKAPLQIARGYQPVEVVTKDGQKISGIAKNEDNFSVQLLDSHDHLQFFTSDELREVIHKKQSLMPNNYDKTLTASELQDVLAFLSRQSTQGAQRREGKEDEQR